MKTARSLSGFQKFACAAAFFAVYASGGALRAEGGTADTSAWDRGSHSGVRLLSGGERDRAGIEIALEPGWKTYWRYPGDSGVPPRFDFTASENVADVTVLFPAPARFADGNGNSIGYSGRVVLPLRITPVDPSKPVTLRAKAEYAICEKICVPADAKAALTLARPSAQTDTLLREAEAKVPRRSSLGASDAFAIVAAKQEQGAKPRVVVDVRAPADAKVDLFAEGSTGDWSLPLPEPVDGGAAGIRRFVFELDGLPSGVSAAGATLLLTATAADGAIEVPIRLE